MVRICRIPEALLVVESAPGETAIDYIALGYICAIRKTFHSGPPHLLRSLTMCITRGLAPGLMLSIGCLALCLKDVNDAMSNA